MHVSMAILGKIAGLLLIVGLRLGCDRGLFR